jgi:hypothetical protein
MVLWALSRSIDALNLPFSIAAMIDPDVACVLPKASTPDVGCTLRSLTHHLALLPGKGNVTVEWRFGYSPKGRRNLHREVSNSVVHNGSFNLLLVPFPYTVHGTDFEVSRPADEDSDGYFRIRQGWLYSKTGKRISSKRISDFLADLMHSAAKQVGVVHGIILPELALELDLAEKVAAQLVALFPQLEIIVCGTLQIAGTKIRNAATVFRSIDGVLSPKYTQSEHHRWRLTGGIPPL